MGRLELPGFLEIGNWTKKSILPLFNFFKNEDVAPALAFFIFSASVLLCVLFLIEVAYIRLQVRRRTRAVARIRDELTFASSMPVVERIMLRSSYLRHAWQKFRETLIEPLPDEESASQVVRNTERPQAYFNATEAGLRFAMFRAMPNLLVGIGLLLTFFGLVTALFFTTDAIKKAADLSASQDALRDLLYAASFKFYTSIAGLGGSIILTLVLRYGTSRIEAGFDELSFALERKMVFVTTEYIAFENLRVAREQTANLRKFNTEVALSIGKRIEEALSENLPNYLAQAMAPIERSLAEVASKLTAMNEGAIGDLAGKFADRLDASTGAHMESLAKTLVELRSSLEQMNSQLTSSGSGLAQHVTSSGAEMQKAVSAIIATAESMQKAGAPLEESSRLIAEASVRVADATQSIERSVVRAQDEIRQIAEMLQSTMNATVKQWEDYEGRFKDVDENLSSVLDQIIRSVQTAIDSLHGFVEKIDEKLSGSVDRLGGGIDELLEFAQTIEQLTAKLQVRSNLNPVP